MNVEIRVTRNLYIKAWILYNSTLTLMAQRSKVAESQAPQSWADETEGIAQLFDEQNISPIPLEDMMKQVEKLEKIKAPDEEVVKTRTDEKPTSEKDDPELKKELLSLFTSDKKLKKKKPEEEATPVAHTKPLISESDAHAGEMEYAESFASQQEIEEMRTEFGQLSERFNELERNLSLMHRERENLPILLNGMKADLNAQLTMFSDKLYAALESHTSNPNVSAVLSTIDTVRAEQSDQLRVAVGHLTSAPKETSPLVTKGSTLKGRGKFKPIK